MRLSCFPNSYGRFGPEAALDLLPDAGILRVELPIKNAGMPSFFGETPLLTNGSSDDDVTRVRERIQTSGVSLSSCNITSGNPLEPEALERTLPKLEMAQALGVDRIVAGGGEVSSEEDWPQLVRHLRQIGDRCAELDLLYCCETHPGTCQNAARMLELLQRVDHPQIKLNFDTGNLFYYNEQVDLLKELHQVLEHIEHVHLKDTNGQFQDWHFPALGAGGAVDFAAVARILNELRPDLICSLEIEGIQGEDPLSLEQTHQRIVDSVNHLRRLGIPIE